MSGSPGACHRASRHSPDLTNVGFIDGEHMAMLYSWRRKDLSIERRKVFARSRKKSIRSENNLQSAVYFSLYNFSISQCDFIAQRLYCIAGIVSGAPRTKLRTCMMDGYGQLRMNGIIRCDACARRQMLRSRKLVSGVSLSANHPNCSNFVPRRSKNVFVIPVI